MTRQRSLLPTKRRLLSKYSCEVMLNLFLIIFWALKRNSWFEVILNLCNLFPYCALPSAMIRPRSHNKSLSIFIFLGILLASCLPVCLSSMYSLLNNISLSNDSNFCFIFSTKSMSLKSFSIIGRYLGTAIWSPIFNCITSAGKGLILCPSLLTTGFPCLPTLTPLNKECDPVTITSFPNLVLILKNFSSFGSWWEIKEVTLARFILPLSGLKAKVVIGLPFRVSTNSPMGILWKSLSFKI